MATEDNEQHILFFFTTCVNHGFTLSRSKRLISPPKRLAHPVTYSLSNRGPFPSGEHSGYGDDCTSPPSIDINNVWRYVFTSPYTFMERGIFPISHLPALLLGYHKRFLQQKRDLCLLVFQQPCGTLCTTGSDSTQERQTKAFETYNKLQYKSAEKHTESRNALS